MVRRPSATGAWPHILLTEQNFPWVYLRLLLAAQLSVRAQASISRASIPSSSPKCQGNSPSRRPESCFILLRIAESVWWIRSLQHKQRGEKSAVFQISWLMYNRTVVAYFITVVAQGLSLKRWSSDVGADDAFPGAVTLWCVTGPLLSAYLPFC